MVPALLRGVSAAIPGGTVTGAPTFVNAAKERMILGPGCNRGVAKPVMGSAISMTFLRLWDDPVIWKRSPNERLSMPAD